MDKAQEILDYLDKTNKKIDRLTTMVTKIAKTLHLIPVTEKEEKALQITQRTNLAIAAKVSAELDEMSPKPEGVGDQSIQSLFSNGLDDVFGDVIADDYLTGGV
jgi:hypothetical protein